MRKIVSFMKVGVLLLLVFALPSYGQSQTVTGTILDADKKIPLAGVSLKVTGTNTTEQTNEKGAFTIKATKGQTITISSIGFETQTVRITGGTFSVSLKASVVELDEVVVSMDMKRKPRELGYSTQNVKGKEIAETQRENFVNSLQGRVAGLTVTPTSGSAGASSAIVLRGYNTMSGNNQPLFILDGVIIDNQTLNTNSQGGSGIGLASDGNNRSNDYTNRIADINPNDIESVTVLKGPEATALYGSQASSGAIVITSKKAKFSNGIILVTYDNSFRMQKVTRYIPTEDNYSPGFNGVSLIPPSSGQTAFTAFGPLYPADTKRFSNIDNFFQTGFAQTHNLGLEFGKKNFGFRFSGQYLSDHGVIPNNTYTKYNFKLSNNTKIGKYIDIQPSIAYTSSDNVKPIRGSTSYLLDLYAWPINNDVRDYQDSKGNKQLLYATSYNAEYDNPFWNAYNNTSGDKLSRLIATLGININPFPWLTLSGRFGYDTYKQDGYWFTHPESNVIPSAATGGTLDNYYRTYKGYNHTISATGKKIFGNFSTRLVVGSMWQDLETQQFGLVGSRLLDSTSTDSSNTLPSSRVRLLRNVSGLPNISNLREMAYFAEASIGYKNVVFLTYSYRFEEASTLPVKNRNYSYPGASLSIIMTDIFPSLKKGNVLNYWKLRSSLANTARLNDPYSNQSVFVNNQFSSTIPSFSYGFTNANPDLAPEKQQTYEVGTEVKLFNSRLTFEAAYYNTLCLDQISQGYRASYATGYILNTGNVSSLRNQGFELTVDVTPIRKKDFEWNIRFNYNKMWSKVLEIPASIGQLNDFYNSDTYITNVRGGLVRGFSTGTMTGNGYLRNNAGQIIINPSTGLAVIDAPNYVRGDRTPQFTLGTLNTFHYKNWNLNFLWDLKVGGDIYNGTDWFLTNIGRSIRTSDRTTPIIVQGVLNDGLQNTATPTKNTIVINPYYLNAYYTTLPDEEYMQKNVNWFRLRDITLSYSLTETTAKKVIKGLKSLSFFITGNDLVLITNYRGSDPAVSSNNPGTAGVGGYGFDYGSIPTPMKLSFGLRTSF